MLISMSLECAWCPNATTQELLTTEASGGFMSTFAHKYLIHSLYTQVSIELLCSCFKKGDYKFFQLLASKITFIKQGMV